MVLVMYESSKRTSSHLLRGGAPSSSSRRLAHAPVPGGEEESRVRGGSALAWDDRLSIGIAEFDADHRSLMTTLSAISEGILRHGQRSSMLVTVDLFAVQTTAHFEAEERKMRAHAYPGFAAHRLEHEQLLSELSELQRSFTFGNEPSVLTIHFLKRWLCDHIQLADRACAEFLRANGVR